MRNNHTTMERNSLDGSTQGNSSSSGSQLRRGGSDRRKNYAAMQNGNVAESDHYFVDVPFSASAASSQTNALKKYNQPNAFTVGLYAMVQDPYSSKYITWSVPRQNEPLDSGGGLAGIGKLVVKDAKKLEKKVLCKHYGHSSFESFQRRLTEYGFVRRTHGKRESHGGDKGFVNGYRSYVHELLGNAPESLLQLKPNTGRVTKYIPNNVGEVNVDNASGTSSTFDDQEVVTKMMPEVYYNQKIHVNEDEVSNLTGVEPKLNMPLEIRDPDSIWSAAKIIKISYGEGKSKECNDADKDGNATRANCTVTIRYEGWGTEWDETLPYPHPRLARIFTYTKKVKCFVDLLPKRKAIASGKKLARKQDPTLLSRGEATNHSTNSHITDVKNWTDIWPCKVSFRMPHPYCEDCSCSQQTDINALFNPPREKGDGETAQQRAELLLRLENNIFIEPYLPEHLPAYLRNRMTHGGWWLNGSKLRLWRGMDVQNPVSLNSQGCVLRELGVAASGNSGVQLEYHFSKDFIAAYQCAQSDGWIQGYLPSKALAEGSLVSEWHRVKNIGGDVIDGVRYSGSFDTSISYKRKSTPSSRGASPIRSSFTDDSNSAQPSTDTPQTIAREDSNNKHDSANDLPFAIPIKDTVYKFGVKHLPHSNRWASTVRISGNDIFLGSFASQTEAHEAAKCALAKHKPSNPTPMDQETIENIGRITDLTSIPIESIVSAFEEKTSNAVESDRLSPIQQRKMEYTSFCLQDWVKEHSREEIMGSMPTANIRRKQQTPKRLMGCNALGII
mmetsp:Transcript_16759/g.33877  ORF Transcript_16759/g.33877 Transcript_16759/m.33877 type:complete len:785 (+) Transcript_16759:72-2426(+)